jgi:type III secretion protein C
MPHSSYLFHKYSLYYWSLWWALWLFLSPVALAYNTLIQNPPAVLEQKPGNFKQASQEVPFSGINREIPQSSYLPFKKVNTIQFVNSESLPELLASFMAMQGINAIIDPMIQGSVSGGFQGATPAHFYEQLVSAYGLVWFYDGNVLYIDPASSVKSEILQANYVDATKVNKLIESLGFLYSNGSVRGMPGNGVIVVSGPPRFVTTVSTLAGKLDAEASVRMARRDAVRVFPLKYAWAIDLSFAYQGGSVTVPGIATLLTNLMLQQGQPGRDQLVDAKSAYNAELSSPGKISSLAGGFPFPLPERSPVPASNGYSASSQDGGVNKQYPGTTSLAPSSNASIQADTRINAVIVRDSEDRMPLYEATIALLDIPVKVVEINAAIVDIQTNYMMELGNRFFSATNTKGGSFGSFETNFQNSIGSAVSNSISFQGMINGVQFLDQIRALENDQHAQILSRPSVMTLDNTQAVINRQQQFYIGVQSTYDASLFNVNAGTILSVTPHVIEDMGHSQVKLVVNIQDGNADTVNLVDGNPVVTQSTLTTQAVIREDKSLLIGGLYYKNDSTVTDGLPFLSRIPLIGVLFGTDSESSQILCRMYLITPKVIDLDTVDSNQFNRYFEPPRIQDVVSLRPKPDGYAKVLPIEELQLNQPDTMVPSDDLETVAQASNTQSETKPPVVQANFPIVKMVSVTPVHLDSFEMDEESNQKPDDLNSTDSNISLLSSTQKCP